MRNHFRANTNLIEASVDSMVAVRNGLKKELVWGKSPTPFLVELGLKTKLALRIHKIASKDEWMLIKCPSCGRTFMDKVGKRVYKCPHEEVVVEVGTNGKTKRRNEKVDGKAKAKRRANNNRRLEEVFWGRNSVNGGEYVNG